MIDRWLHLAIDEEEQELGPLNFALKEEVWDESEYDGEKADSLNNELDDEDWTPESEF